MLSSSRPTSSDEPPAVSLYDEDEAPAELVEVVFLTNGGKSVEVPAGSNLLRMSMRGEGGIPFKCGGGICGTCRCLLEEGKDNTAPVTKKERKHLSDEEIAEGWRMACQTTLTGPLKVSWVPLEERKK
jgi:ferredoxin